MLCISPSGHSPFSVHVSMERRFSEKVTPIAEATYSCHPKRSEGSQAPKTFLLLYTIQLDDWQIVDAENRRDFAAVMDVMFEHTPDDPLA